MAGDRLLAAKLVDTDRCPHCDQEHRHTTKHMFWHCEKHNKCRKEAVTEIHKIFNKTAQLHGPIAKEHLADILENNAFQHTGICPEDTKAIATYKQITTKDDIFETVPINEKESSATTPQ